MRTTPGDMREMPLGRRPRRGLVAACGPQVSLFSIWPWHAYHARGFGEWGASRVGVQEKGMTRGALAAVAPVIVTLLAFAAHRRAKPAGRAWACEGLTRRGVPLEQGW